MVYKNREIPKYMRKTPEEEARGEEPYSPEEFKNKRLAQGLTPTEITTPSSILGQIRELETMPINPNLTEIPETEEALKNLPAENLLPSIQGNLPQRLLGAGKVLGQASPLAILANTLTGKQTEGGQLAQRSIADVYDVMHSAITRKKPLKYSNALESFTEITDMIDRNIQNIREGGSYARANQDFKRGIISLQRLENSAKFFGTFNLNWWIDDGISIQTEIINQKDLLEDLRIELLRAKAEVTRNAQIQELKARFPV